MSMTARDNPVLSPIGWTPVTGGDPGEPPAAHTKDLLVDPHGDSFVLLRLTPGAVAAPPAGGTSGDRYLVLSGRVDVSGAWPVTHHRGDYLALPDGPDVALASPDGAIVLRLSGPRLGDPVRDAFGPTGWFPAGPGQWARLLLAMPADGTFDERLVGLCHMEAGSASARHPHPTAHRFLYLEGVAEDEIVFADGRRETATRRAGEFVDYPSGVDHQTFTRDGCLVLFVHAPLRR